jgi:hypothetical protein
VNTINRIGPGAIAALGLLMLMTAAAVSAVSGESEPDESDAHALAARMLQAIGGRPAWAALRNTVNGSEQYRAVEPTVVYSVITMDFEKARFRIETMAEELYLVRVVDGDTHWRMGRGGEVTDGRPETVEADHLWYAAHLYRTLHRIAVRDPALQLGVADDGRLEVYEDGDRLVWFRLDVRGEPYAFGVRDDETGSLTGPWNFVRDGIHHPRWVSNADGSWRAAVRALSVNVPLRQAMFDRPGGD